MTFVGDHCNISEMSHIPITPTKSSCEASMGQVSEAVTEGSTTYSISASYMPKYNLEKYKTLSKLGASVTSTGHDTTLYSRRLSVRYRHPNLKFDYIKRLNAVISWQLSSRSDSNSNDSSRKKKKEVKSSKVLSLKFFDDDTSNILLHSTLNSTSFEILRQEQRLLVDFEAFPTMLIELLERCNTNETHDYKEDGDSSVGETTPALAACTSYSDSENQMTKVRFADEITEEYPKGNEDFCESQTPVCSTAMSLVAMLVCHAQDEENSTSTMSSQSTSLLLKTCMPPGKKAKPSCRPISRATLCLIETSYFKELLHLSMEFVQATDEEWKKHLVTRLAQHRIYCRYLEKENKSLLSNRAELAIAYRHSKEACEYMERNKSGMEEAYRIELNNKLHAMEQAHNEELSKLAKMSEEQMKTVKLEQSQMRCELSSKKNLNDKLSKQVDTFAKEKVDLRKQLIQAQSQLHICEDELEQLKRESKDFLEVSDLLKQTQLELSEVKSNIRKLETQIEQKNSEKAELEQSLKLANAREASLLESVRTSVQEIVKGNELIDKLQTALTSQKQKIKEMKEEMALKLQKGAEQDEIDSDLRLKYAELQKENLTQEKEIDSLKKNIEVLTQKVVQFEEVVKQDQTTIERLDTQLNNRIVDSLVGPLALSKIPLVKQADCPPPLLYTRPSFDEALSPFNQTTFCLSPRLRWLANARLNQQVSPRAASTEKGEDFKKPPSVPQFQSDPQIAPKPTQLTYKYITEGETTKSETDLADNSENTGFKYGKVEFYQPKLSDSLDISFGSKSQVVFTEEKEECPSDSRVFTPDSARENMSHNVQTRRNSSSVPHFGR